MTQRNRTPLDRRLAALGAEERAPLHGSRRPAARRPLAERLAALVGDRPGTVPPEALALPLGAYFHGLQRTTRQRHRLRTCLNRLTADYPFSTGTTLRGLLDYVRLELKDAEEPEAGRSCALKLLYLLIAAPAGLARPSPDGKLLEPDRDNDGKLPLSSTDRK